MADIEDLPVFSFFTAAPELLIIYGTDSEIVYFLEESRESGLLPRFGESVAQVSRLKSRGTPEQWRNRAIEGVIGSAGVRGIRELVQRLEEEEHWKQNVLEAHQIFAEEIKPHLAEGVKVWLRSAFCWVPFLHVDGYNLEEEGAAYRFGPVDIGVNVEYSESGFGCDFNVVTLQTYRHPAVKIPRRYGRITYPKGDWTLPSGINDALFEAKRQLQGMNGAYSLADRFADFRLATR